MINYRAHTQFKGIQIQKNFKALNMQADSEQEAANKGLCCINLNTQYITVTLTQLQLDITLSPSPDVGLSGIYKGDRPFILAKLSS